MAIVSLLPSGQDNSFKTQYNFGLEVGANFSIIYCIALSSTIIGIKKLYTSFSAILLFLLTIIGATTFGCLLGCIFPAILSTYEAKE